MDKLVQFIKKNKLKKKGVASALGVSRQWFDVVLASKNIRGRDLSKIASLVDAHLCIVKDNEVILEFTEEDFEND